MRTTVDLPDHLLVEAKKLAAERRQSLTRVFEESLRTYLAEERMQRPRELEPLPVVGGRRARVALDDTSELLELE